jgi:YbbR domain-containing protein
VKRWFQTGDRGLRLLAFFLALILWTYVRFLSYR